MSGWTCRPAAAEEWLAQFPARPATDRSVLNDFARNSASKWAAKAQQSTAGWVRDLAAWAIHWRHHPRRDGIRLLADQRTAHAR